MRKTAYRLSFVIFLLVLATVLWAESPARPQHPSPANRAATRVLNPRTVSATAVPQGQAKAPAVASPAAVDMSYAQAQPVLAAINGGLPAELRDKTPADLETLWPAWLSRHDAETRARLMRGDEDTMVNFLVLGISFTRQPRLTATDFARAAGGLGPNQLVPDKTPESNLLFNRVADLMRGLASPGGNERLLFISQLVEKLGYHPQAAFGPRPNLAERNRLKSYLLTSAGRVFREQERLQIIYDQARQKKNHPEDVAEVSTLYRSRGVSLDTSLWPNMAIEESLKTMMARGLLTPGSVHRAAVIGPGLDFTDKLGGYDFYPQQTIQCFALVDSLLRLGLAQPGDLQVTTFDISQRVNDHLHRVRRRGHLGQPYVLQLPRDAQASWHPPSSFYWRQFGDKIGSPVAPIRPPEHAGSVETRAIQIRPAITSIINPLDLNIVTQRLDIPPGQGFDVVIATNVFAYFDSFEQLLAVSNTESMLRPGGFLLSNNVLPILPSIPMQLVNHLSLSYSERPNDGDVVSWYQRSPE